MPPAGASFSDLGASTTTASAVVSSDATPLASCNADRTTYEKSISRMRRTGQLLAYFGGIDDTSFDHIDELVALSIITHFEWRHQNFLDNDTSIFSGILGNG